MSISQDELNHFRWAIKSRQANQMCSLRLLTLFNQYGEKWKTKKYSLAAQELLAVAFSLWRAAFLANKTGKRSEVFAHGQKFLKKFVEDNAIAYPQDKESNEWTFNYYTRNARSSLQSLEDNWPAVAPKYRGKNRTPKERWDYCQSLLDQAVKNFEKHLGAWKAGHEGVNRRKKRRIERKANRAKVRAITLAERNRVRAVP